MKKILSIIIGLIFIQTANAIWVLDDFDAPTLGQTTSYPNNSTVFTGNAAFGNYRTIEWGPSTPFNSEYFAQVNVNIGEAYGAFYYNQNVSSMAQMRLKYDANGAGLNLNLSDITYFGLLSVYSDMVGFTINYNFVDNGSILANGSWQPPVGSWSDLTTYIGPQPGWTSIDAIILEFIPHDIGADITFDSFGWESRSGFIPHGDPSIPEPSSALLISGLLALGVGIRKFIK